ncbi:c-type heme family protein [Desulfonatronovibrio magnus]|uniref:c-type heme family protein n=1 Tax=Desulfonatronovibrio magnus TaxID=698827 RepID=UPI000697532E|nr:DUF3365 domain-containing protein [Desulfonatronovibrio magnus]
MQEYKNTSSTTELRSESRNSKFFKLSMGFRSRFLVGTGLILLLVCFVSAFVIYYREKSLLEDSAYSKTELVMASIEASRMYIRDELRPKMIERFGEDFFMLEAMSTSYVGRAVMDNLKRNLPEHSYRRVSINARNPDSEANAMERGMLAYFQDNQNQKNWQGLLENKGDAFYMRFKPVYFEHSCMSCHGSPEDAPAELLSLYGTERGFGHYPGELAGVIAVGIPVQSALAAIQEKATSVFLVVFFGVSLFYLTLIVYFNWTVVSNIRGVLNIFREEVDDDSLPEIFDDQDSNDEIEVLSAAAQSMASHLKHTREELKKYAQNLELKVEDRTSALKKSEELLKEKVIIRNKELYTLNSIAELTTQARGLADIWPGALGQILKMMPARGVGIYLLDESTGNLRLKFQQQAQDLPVHVQCLQPDRELKSIDLSSASSNMKKSVCSALKGNMHSFKAAGYGHCLNVPLYCRGKVLGIMSFVRVNYAEILPEQKELLLSIGRQMGIAVESLNGLQKLIQSKELLQSVFDGITDLVILMDKNFRIKMVNKGYIDKFKVEPEDVYDIPCYEAHSGLKTACPHCGLNKVVQTKEPYVSESRCGTGEIYLVHFYPVLDENGELESIIRYARDITDQKKVESRIQHTEKLVAMGQLAAGVAHEINNPLGIILCYIDLLKRQLADFPQGLKDLNIIEKQTLNCKQIVTDLLQFSRGQESTKAFASINHTIEDVIQMFRHQFKKQKIDVSLNLEPDMPHVNFDENKIKQVFVNLVMNACQAIQKNGTISIHSRFENESSQVRLTVRDSGQGMDPEIRKKIFDPFFSTKKTGESTGLGLSVSYGIIQDHGGEIYVSSQPSEWTEFTIIMPVAGN